MNIIKLKKLVGTFAVAGMISGNCFAATISNTATDTFGNELTLTFEDSVIPGLNQEWGNVLVKVPTSVWSIIDSIIIGRYR